MVARRKERETWGALKKRNTNAIPVGELAELDTPVAVSERVSFL
jgi:hypothetical protein